MGLLSSEAADSPEQQGTAAGTEPQWRRGRPTVAGVLLSRRPAAGGGPRSSTSSHSSSSGLDADSGRALQPRVALLHNKAASAPPSAFSSRSSTFAVARPSCTPPPGSWQGAAGWEGAAHAPGPCGLPSAADADGFFLVCDPRGTMSPIYRCSSHSSMLGFLSVSGVGGGGGGNTSLIWHANSNSSSHSRSSVAPSSASTSSSSHHIGSGGGSRLSTMGSVLAANAGGLQLSRFSGDTSPAAAPTAAPAGFSHRASHAPAGSAGSSPDAPAVAADHVGGLVSRKSVASHASSSRASLSSGGGGGSTLGQQLALRASVAPSVLAHLPGARNSSSSIPVALTTGRDAGISSIILVAPSGSSPRNSLASRELPLPLLSRQHVVTSLAEQLLPWQAACWQRSSITTTPRSSSSPLQLINSGIATARSARSSLAAVTLALPPPRSPAVSALMGAELLCAREWLPALAASPRCSMLLPPEAATDDSCFLELFEQQRTALFELLLTLLAEREQAVGAAAAGQLVS